MRQIAIDLALRLAQTKGFLVEIPVVRQKFEKYADNLIKGFRRRADEARQVNPEIM